MICWICDQNYNIKLDDVMIWRWWYRTKSRNIKFLTTMLSFTSADYRKSTSFDEKWRGFISRGCDQIMLSSPDKNYWMNFQKKLCINNFEEWSMVRWSIQESSRMWRELINEGGSLVEGVIKLCFPVQTKMIEWIFKRSFVLMILRNDQWSDEVSRNLQECGESWSVKEFR